MNNMGTYHRHYRWKSEIEIINRESGEVEIDYAMFDLKSEHDAIIAGARVLRKMIETDPDVARDNVYVVVSSNQHFVDFYGPDSADIFEVIGQHDYFDAMRTLQNHDWASGATKMIERVSCELDKSDGIDIIFNDAEFGIEVHVLGADDGFVRHVRITGSSLQVFEEFAASAWQAVELLGRAQELSREENPF